MTSEVQAPLGDDEPEALVQSLSRVRGRVDGVSVSDVELEGVVGDSIQTCDLLLKTGSTPSIRPPPETRTGISFKKT